MSVTYFEKTDKVTRANVNEKIDEINFQNGELDTKIESTLLYSNSSGTSGTVTLSQSCENFKRVCVYYGYGNIMSYATFDVADSIGRGSINICVNYISSPFDQFYFRTALIYLNSTSITWGRSTTMYANVGGSTGLKRDELLKISKVVGYKY